MCYQLANCIEVSKQLYNFDVINFVIFPESIIHIYLIIFLDVRVVYLCFWTLP